MYVCTVRVCEKFGYLHEQLETSISTRMVRFLSHRFPSSEAIDYYGVLREGTPHTFSIDGSPCVRLLLRSRSMQLTIVQSTIIRANQ